MAFGGLKGSLTGNNASIGTSLAATGSVSVAVGDLVFFCLFEQLATTITACGDNIHGAGTYTLFTAIDAGTTTAACGYRRVTTAGTLTAVTAVVNGGTNNGVIDAIVIEGPFVVSPLDLHPTDISNDISSPYLSPASGALSYAPEVAVSWFASTGSATMTVAAPYTKDTEHATAAIGSVRIARQVVGTAASVAAASWTGTAPTDDVLGTATFKAAPLPDTTWPPNSFVRPRSKIPISVIAASGLVLVPNPTYPPPGPALFTGAGISSAAISEVSISGGEPVTAQAAEVIGPDRWMPRWTGPSRPNLIRTRVDESPFVTSPAVPVSPAGWLQRFSPGAPTRPLPARGGGSIDFAPSAAAVVSPAAWLQPFSRPPLRVKANYQNFNFVAVISDVAITPSALEWLQPLSRSVTVERYPQGALISGYEPPAVVVDNNQTIDKWQQPLSRAVPIPRPAPVGGTPFVPSELVLYNTTTTLWPLTFGEKARPVPRAAQQGSHLFVPSEQLIDNTTTRLWPLTFGEKARPIPRVAPQGMWAFGYPYLSVFVDNNQTIDKWQQPFSRSVTRRPAPGGYWAFGSPPDRGNTVTIDKWQQPLSVTINLGWPRRNYLRGGQQPFVPRDVVGDNTIRGIPWLQAWKGPPRVSPAKTQVTYPVSQPPAVASNLVTTLAWMPPWRGPKRSVPPRIEGFFFAKHVQVVYQQTIDCDVTVTVNLHVCGWGTEAEAAEGFVAESEQTDVWSDQSEAAACGFETAFQADAFQSDAFQICDADPVEQTEETDAWSEQAESSDEFTEKDECGR